MARINGVVLSDDETFRAQVGSLLRGGPVPIAPVSESGGQRADIVVIDARGDLGAAMARAEHWRASGPVGVFAIASDSTPDLILQAMREGANEFFAWPPPEATFHEAVRRAAGRVVSSTSAPASQTIVFIGAKG